MIARVDTLTLTRTGSHAVISSVSRQQHYLKAAFFHETDNTSQCFWHHRSYVDCCILGYIGRLATCICFTRNLTRAIIAASADLILEHAVMVIVKALCLRQHLLPSWCSPDSKLYQALTSKFSCKAWSVHPSITTIAQRIIPRKSKLPLPSCPRTSSRPGLASLYAPILDCHT